MTSLTVGTLKEICDRLPDDYIVALKTSDTTLYLKDNIEIDISQSLLILKD